MKKNMAASVRQRLTNLARARGEDFGLVLVRYGLERLLYRLSQSAYRDQFVLKGALLFQLWSGESHRPTHDLDLLGQGENVPQRFEPIFRDFCRQAVEDGLTFLEESVRSERIREDQLYQAVRIRCEARLQNARIPLQIDIGFGDAITPEPTKIEYPCLLDLPAPCLRAYPRETVVAEKFDAMVTLGMSNSRMKDFYDLLFLARKFSFDGGTLAQAIQATFQRRRTKMPVEAPLALTPEFTGNPMKLTQWNGFLRKNKLDVEGLALNQIAAVLSDFLLPVVKALTANNPFVMVWPASGPWHEEKG